MTTDTAQTDATIDSTSLPDIRIPKPTTKADFATIFGLIFAIGLIIGAIAMGNSDANFINTPSLMIVLLGTFAATAVSFTIEELTRASAIITKSMFRRVRKPSILATNLISLSVIAKKKGLLSLSAYEDQFRKDPFMANAMQLVIDGYESADIERFLFQELEAQIERHKRSASITKRAAETAPAMGLIGTLVGLVQMLANLEDPEAIGPAMAVALLTTFYGAILGTIVMSPLSAKLEKNSDDETLIRTLIIRAATSIANQENPRKLEMTLNAELPPLERIRYFD